ncbi:MAG: hypothetical protein BAJALOKI1v1_1480006 [Promethearchaeota archaeon]|nr:MAG: hypothetical protein BAJALOKI1v1_1480006 [Candidatus Lokiarchaeota archaeon]
MPSQKITLSKYFKDGIHFSCLQCGECCRGLNNGEVYLYREDIERLVEHLNSNGQQYTLTSFSRKYVKVVRSSFYWENSKNGGGKNYSFKALGIKFIGEDESCPFLVNNCICSVHTARPYQCRAYPIGWNMLIKSNRNFAKYSKDCPGLKKSLEQKGEYYTPKEIIKWARKEYQMEKQFFLEMKKHQFDLFKTYSFLPKDLSQ